MKDYLTQFTSRGIAGAGIFILTIIVFALIAWKPTLADNDLFKMLAQAIVVQGLVGLAMAHWFTSGPRAADKEEDDAP